MPELAILQPVPAIVIIPAEGDKLAPAPMLKVPFTVKPEEVVVVPVVLRLAKTKVPELLIEPAFLVTVPPVGEKLPVAPTVKTAFTENETFEVFVPLNVTPLNVRVPELLIVVVPVSKVIVPPVGAKVLPEDTVSALLIV